MNLSSKQVRSYISMFVCTAIAIVVGLVPDREDGVMLAKVPHVFFIIWELLLIGCVIGMAIQASYHNNE